MKTFFSKIKTYVLAHKVISAVVLIIVVFLGYKTFGGTSAGAATSYVLGTVQKGIVISSVSESGQVTTTNELDVKAQVSGTITWVGIQPGDEVHAGQAL